MKIQRFTAETNQQVLMKVHQQLGPEALIHSTRKKGNEIEILASLPGSSDSVISDNLDAENINKQIQSIQASLAQIAERIHMDHSEEQDRNQLYYYLGNLGFRGKFRRRFVDQYINENDNIQVINQKKIDEKITQCLKVDEFELIDTKNICALVGPTGVGKSTTIVKLAKRYINKYNNQSIGIISTDVNEVTTKNLLTTYCQIFDIDLLHVSSPLDFKRALTQFADKNFILIDSSGISQKNTQKIEELIALRDSHPGEIAWYLTLPCHLQDTIMEDIARAFSSLNLAGCILTKTDECLNIGPAVNLCLNHDLSIAYLCNGQNIYADIAPAEVREIMSSIKTANLLNERAQFQSPLSKATEALSSLTSWNLGLEGV